MTDDWMQRFMDKIDGLIRQYDMAVQHVFPGEADSDFAFSYTVGLAEKGWPELILTGLHPQNSQMILNEVVKRLRQINEEPKPDMLVDKALNFPMKLTSVGDHEIQERLRIASVRSKLVGLDASAVHALQVVWPDPAGKFPGDPGYDVENFPQPMLDAVWAKPVPKG